MRLGDFVRIGDVEGTVTHLGVLSTKLRTLRNEDVTVPNAVVVSQTTTDFSRYGDTAGVFTPTTVTIGYDAPVASGARDAAARRRERTAGIRREPTPLVLQAGLEDFYVKYMLLRLPRAAGPAADRPGRAAREHPGRVQRVRRADHVAELRARSRCAEGGAEEGLVRGARRRRTAAKSLLAAGPRARRTELTPQQPLWYEVVTPTYYPAVDESRRLTITVIVCAYNEARHLPACLHSLLAQTRPPDEILVVNNASTDATGAVARAIPGVRVLDEPSKGLVIARETARRAARSDVLAYVDADCRAPITWLDQVERRLQALPDAVAVTGPYRFYDWDWAGRTLHPAVRLARRAAHPRPGPPRDAGGRDSVRRQLRRPARRAGADRRLRQDASSFTAKTRIWAAG